MFFARQESRALIDPESNLFPAIAGKRQENLWGFQLYRSVQLRDVEIGYFLPDIDLLGPNGIRTVLMLEDGHIQGKVIKAEVICAIEHAHFDPCIG